MLSANTTELSWPNTTRPGPGWFWVVSVMAISQTLSSMAGMITLQSDSRVSASARLPFEISAAFGISLRIS